MRALSAGALLLLTACGGGMGAVEDVSVGSMLGCARGTEGKAWCWGLPVLAKAGTWNTPTEVPQLEGMTSITVTDYAVFATRANGSVFAFGDNYVGQLGDTTTTTGLSVREVSTLRGLKGFSGSSQHTCALGENGKVLCWGSNGEGQVGASLEGGERCTVGSIELSCRREPFEVPGLSGVTQVSAEAGSATCALMADRTVQCWGDNVHGVLGDGTTTSRHTPAPVKGLSNVAEVVVSGSAFIGQFACARLTDGTVRCWGSNVRGQLGSADAPHRCKNVFGQEAPCALEPREVPGLTGVVQLSAGGAFVCARMESGSLVCWGYNADGQLGRGVRASKNSTGELPGPVPGLSGVTQVSAGYNAVCARLEDTSLWCWGNNDNHQVGIPESDNQPSPVRLE